MAWKPAHVLTAVAIFAVLFVLYSNVPSNPEDTQHTEDSIPVSGNSTGLSKDVDIGDADWIEANQLQTVDYLIITPSDYAENLQPLVTWKTQRGLVSTVETTESINEKYGGSDLAERIRNCIKQYHSEKNTAWILLAGGDELVPSRTVEITGPNVKSDYYYSNLDDNWALEPSGAVNIIDLNDWEAEVFVGRLPADNAAQMDSLVARIIEYERSPTVGPWMTHALFAGTFCTFNRDANGNNVFDGGDVEGFDTNRNHNWLKANILPADWTSTLLAEREGAVVTTYPCDGSLNEQTFTEAVNQGASIVMADAHGSEDGIFRSIFLTDQDGDKCFDSGSDAASSAPFISTHTQFDNGGKNSFFFLAACSTGTFTMGDCLTEYLVRTCGIGAIGSYKSANYDSRWYDGEHLGWFVQGLSTRFWEQLIVAGNNHPGMAFSLAKDDYSKDKVAMNGPGANSLDDAKALAQFNLMGDPEVPIWTNIPTQITADIDVDAAGVVSIKALDNGETLPGVTVTLTSPTYYVRAITNEFGETSLPLPSGAELEKITITLSKNHYLPYQKQLG
jgi:hypothetical protein